MQNVFNAKKLPFLAQPKVGPFFQLQKEKSFLEAPDK
jgi:hypothetical protein